MKQNWTLPLYTMYLLCVYFCSVTEHKFRQNSSRKSLKNQVLESCFYKIVSKKLLFLGLVTFLKVQKGSISHINVRILLWYSGSDDKRCNLLWSQGLCYILSSALRRIPLTWHTVAVMQCCFCIWIYWAKTKSLKLEINSFLQSRYSLLVKRINKH